VVCTDLTPGVPLSAAQFARGTIDAGTVQNVTASAQNQLQSADISNGGNTGTPDLVSATLDLTGVTGQDVINLVFDQPVATNGAATTLFQAYTNTSGILTPIAGNGGSATAASSPNNVQLVFTDGTLTNVVGVSVDENAVLATTGSNIGLANSDDEVGITNSNTSSPASGRTASPDLISVKRTAATDLFGAATGSSNFTFTFDETVDAANAGNFFVYLADGTRGTLGGCAPVLGAGGAATANVTCTSYTGITNTQAGTAVLGTVTPGAVSQSAATNLNNGAEGGEVITS